MDKFDELSDEFTNSFVRNYDKKFRLSFEEYIRENKKLTHKCQFECYEKKEKLSEGEDCARNCFQPLLFTKKNTSYLMEGVKEKFEKCKFEARQEMSSYSKSKMMKKCFLEYDEKMKGIKTDLDYIYQGYLKNFNEIVETRKDKPLQKI